MLKINSKNLLEFLHAYLKSIGLSVGVDELLNAKQFTDALILKLPMVCIVKDNRPEGTPGNQTHIHVTGNNRYFFFSQDEINAATGSTDDIKQEVIICEQNIKSLLNENISSNNLALKPTHTMIKLGHGANKQVQISKLRKDGNDFIDLRKGLHENDLLIFLKYRNDDKMLVLGIPHSFYFGAYEFQNDIYSGLESKGTVTVKNALDSVMNEYEESAVISGNDTISDVVYQEMVDIAEPSNTDYEPVKYIPSYPFGKNVKSNRPVTNPSIGKEALKDGFYRCLIDANHKTFIKKNGNPYMEVHHLIPLEWQDEFENKLDTKANLIPICPTCHKLLHYGRIEDIKNILSWLYEVRIEHLRESGLDINLEKLIDFYK